MKLTKVKDEKHGLYAVRDEAVVRSLVPAQTPTLKFGRNLTFLYRELQLINTPVS